MALARPCHAAGCRSFRGQDTYSPYCPAHRKAVSRHGHPLQTAVLGHELAPFLRVVAVARKRNADNAAWSMLVERWQRLVNHASRLLAMRDAGAAFIRHEAQAAEMLRTVAGTVEPSRVIDAALALFLLQDHSPGRFKSDRAFWFALARRVRHLAPMNRGTYWNAKTKRTTGVYRDAPPRATEVLAQWLVEVFGLAGRLLADLERQRAEQVHAEHQRLADAVAAMR